MTDALTGTSFEAMMIRVINAEVFLANERIKDVVPEKVTVNRALVITKARELANTVIEKHKEASASWQEATDLYVKNVQLNPGSQAIRSPGEKPKLTGVEEIYGFIRALECFTGDEVVLSRTQLFNVFANGSNAVQQMRGIRDTYVTMVSGATAATTGSGVWTGGGQR